jgi:hypothetical protein
MSLSSHYILCSEEGDQEDNNKEDDERAFRKATTKVPAKKTPARAKATEVKPTIDLDLQERFRIG